MDPGFVTPRNRASQKTRWAAGLGQLLMDIFFWCRCVFLLHGVAIPERTSRRHRRIFLPICKLTSLGTYLFQKPHSAPLQNKRCRLASFPVPVPAYRTFDPRNTVRQFPISFLTREIPHSYRPRKSPRRASTCHQRKLGQSEIVSAQEHRLRRRRRRRHGAARRPVLCAWLCELWIPYYDCGGWNLGVWQEYLLASESAGPQL